MEESANWFEQGVALFENRNFDGALAAFEKAITFNQHPVEAWFNRGLVFAESGRYKQALQSFDETLLRNPDHENAKIARTMVLERMGDAQNTGPAPFAAPASNGTVTISPVGTGPVPAPGSEPVRSPLFALLFSFIFPGWGQWYNGRRWDGLFFLGASVLLAIANLVLAIILNFNILVSAVFTMLGLGLLVFGMYNAYTTAEKINLGEIEFIRKSRLFWLPVVMFVLVIVLLIVSLVLAFMVFGMAANAHHTKVVAVTAMQPASDKIIVTYHGGQDAQQVSRVMVSVTDAAGSTQEQTLDPEGNSPTIAIGSTTTFTGSYSGKDRVLATAKFRDGTSQLILDNYI